MSAVSLPDEPLPSRSPQPRALIVTIYGLYAREVGGWLGIGDLIRLMGTLGIDDAAVRSSISRLKRRGILESERQDAVAGYTLSGQARTMLDEGDRRIFARPRARLDDGWVLAVFSVPESQRQQRHALRSRLTWLGFGTVSAGVWIAPAHVEDEAREVLERHGLSAYVTLFHSRYLGFGDVAEQAQQWWDLDGLARMYDRFIAAHAPVLARWRRRRTAHPTEAFADYVHAVTDWRRLPFLDPGLPPEVTPPDWHGERAARLFFDLRDRLAGQAHDHVTAIRARD